MIVVVVTETMEMKLSWLEWTMSTGAVIVSGLRRWTRDKRGEPNQGKGQDMYLHCASEHMLSTLNCPALSGQKLARNARQLPKGRKALLRVKRHTHQL